eukprot:3361099-Rhodomonas_salina.3
MGVARVMVPMSYHFPVFTVFTKIPPVFTKSPPARAAAQAAGLRNAMMLVAARSGCSRKNPCPALSQTSFCTPRGKGCSNRDSESRERQLADTACVLVDSTQRKVQR